MDRNAVEHARELMESARRIWQAKRESVAHAVDKETQAIQCAGIAAVSYMRTRGIKQKQELFTLAEEASAAGRRTRHSKSQCELASKNFHILQHTYHGMCKGGDVFAKRLPPAEGAGNHSEDQTRPGRRRDTATTSGGEAGGESRGEEAQAQDISTQDKEGT